MLKTPIDGLISRFDKSEEDFAPIFTTGGGGVENIDPLAASQMLIPHEYLIKRSPLSKRGDSEKISGIEVLLPDFKPSKPWQLQKGQELAARFPGEYKQGKRPKKKDMSPELRQAYDEIVAEYRNNRVGIAFWGNRDIYSAKFSWEGQPSLEKLRELSDKGVYHGPVTGLTRGELVNRPGYDVVKKVGKYGEGKWPYRDGFVGSDFIQQEGNSDHPLWEYGDYSPVGARNPRKFYYVPVVPEKPHQIYIQCGWNGNVDYINKVNCNAKSVLDETIAYSFSFRRPRLVEFHDINQKVVQLLQSFIVDKGTFAELSRKRQVEQK